MISVDLFDILQAAWRTLCAGYDVTSELPDIGVLFAGVDPSEPEVAARTIVVNLLSEAMECVGRFSPWYKQSARAYGVVLRHGEGTRTSQWVLSDEAIQTHSALLHILQHAIERNKSVILATRFLEDLEQQDEHEEPCRAATCRCYPPRTILIHRSVYGRTQIVCDTCHQQFV